MVTGSKKLSIKRCCELVSISRSTMYYEAKMTSDDDDQVMDWIDKAHTRWPWYGARSLKTYLALAHGYVIARKRVRRLMRLMNIRSLAPGPTTSKPNPAHKKYPYLLRGLNINRPNQVWATDITYIRMPRGFIYLVAIIDWHSRKVLSWRLSNSLDTKFCIDALEEALSIYGHPEIFNTDQGCQFTSTEFTQVLESREIKISMDGKGCWVDNVFIERVWRSLKYEEVYLNAYESVPEAEQRIGQYFAYYNTERFHQSLSNKTPDAVYYANVQKAAA